MRYVASHLRALVDGGISREVYSREDSSWESKDQAEHSENHSDVDRLLKEPLHDSSVALGGDITHPESETSHDAHADIDDAPQRKRRRNQVDYKALYEKMKKEGEM